jgi:hypothetical protein
MKTTCIILLLTLILLGCSDSKVRGLEELPQVHVKIYKTNADYFNYINLWGKDHEHTSNTNISSRFNIFNCGTTFLYRWKLEQGYVADVTEIWYTDYFTNISFKEMLRYNESNGTFHFDSIETRIIDKAPFIEFYVDDQDLFYKMPEQIDEINEIISKGEIEKYLRRLK